MKNTTSTTTSETFAEFHCTGEWHFARMSSLACVVHTFSMFLSKRTGVFWPSVPKLAEYFGVDERTIRRAVKDLKDEGFFVLTKAAPGQPRYYRVLSHSDWKKANPGKCVQKMTTPWEEENKDGLAMRLYALSGGEKFFPNFVKGARNTGHSDDAIAQHFEAFFTGDKGGRKERYKRFMEYLRKQAVTQ